MTIFHSLRGEERDEVFCSVRVAVTQLAPVKPRRHSHFFSPHAPEGVVGFKNPTGGVKNHQKSDEALQHNLQRTEEANGKAGGREGARGYRLQPEPAGPSN